MSKLLAQAEACATHADKVKYQMVEQTLVCCFKQTLLCKMSNSRCRPPACLRFTRASSPPASTHPPPEACSAKPVHPPSTVHSTPESPWYPRRSPPDRSRAPTTAHC